MSQNVRPHLCLKVKEKFSNTLNLRKSPIRIFFVVLCFFAKFEQQRTVKKHMGGSTRIEDQNVLLHLACLASECSLTTIAKEK